MLILAETNYWLAGLALLFMLVCIILMLAILIQRPRGGGLSGAFGGSSNAQAVFGSKTGDALTWITVVLFAGFLILAILLTHMVRPSAADATPATPSPSNSSAPGSPGSPGSPGTPGTPGTPGSPVAPKSNGTTKPPAPAIPALPDAAKLPPLDDAKVPVPAAESIKPPATAPAAEGQSGGHSGGGSEAVR